MKVFFFGEALPGSTSLMRMHAFRSLGHDVACFDRRKYFSPIRFIRAFRERVFPGSVLSRMNRDVTREAGQFKPDLVWVEKGTTIWPETIRGIKELFPSCLVAHYNPDDPFGLHRHGWDVFLKAIPEYDLHVLMRDVNVPEYQAAGAKRVIRWPWGFDPATHRPIKLSPEEHQRLDAGVGFVGSYEEDRARSIAGLCDQGIKVQIWGNGWERCRFRSPNMKIGYRDMMGDEYAKAICAIDINLGFLRKANRDLSTTRSIEIPACAAFMLAERTSEHLELFKEGEEAEFFASEGELLDKVRYYLEHKEERLRIAAAGRRRCLDGGYSYADRLRLLLSRF